ncbi:hypothetical protein [Streptomyces sp. NPDC089915]|uniref:tetratricopeptide repeat protein n=1 Tax=Streptomyces sp. NPDC089915 TaxID=3155186 RepID=UPI00343E2EAE
MDAADLDRRFRSDSPRIPAYLVSRLLELGHAEEVAFQAGRGEWFCARELARRLAGQGLRAEAWEVLAPYLASGSWTAAETAAGLLEEWGKADEAIALARPHADGGTRQALAFLGRLLARHGRGGQAFALLLPHLEDAFLATALVDVARPAGREEEVAALLAARIETPHRCADPGCDRARIAPANAVSLLATVQERRGRVDEAVALLRPVPAAPPAHAHAQLADVLARHGRMEQLREYAAELGNPARRLAELLEERGDVEGAIAVYRGLPASDDLRPFTAAHLADLLERHGRGDEAIEVMRALVDASPGAEDWVVRRLCALYAGAGRALEGLAYLDDLKSLSGGEDWEFFELRLPLLAAEGRSGEALALVRAHPEGDTWYAADSVARLHAEAGRLDEAVTVLRAHACDLALDLAEHLITLGRVREAVAVLQER